MAPLTDEMMEALPSCMMATSFVGVGFESPDMDRDEKDERAEEADEEREPERELVFGADDMAWLALELETELDEIDFEEGRVRT